MPSGAKKRKAAKKKKEMGASSNKNNNNKPRTLSHVGAEEMTKEDTSGVRSNARESEFMVYSVITSTNKGATHQNSGIQFMKDLKPKDDLSIRNVSITLVDDSSSSSSGGSISGGSISSDDDCHALQKGAEVTESGQPNTSPDMEKQYRDFSMLTETLEQDCDSHEGTQVTNDALAQEGYVVLTKKETCRMPEVMQVTDGKNKSSEDKVSDAVDIIVQDDHGILVLSPDVRAVDSGLCAEHVSKCSESKPLIPSASKSVEKSSWKSCCGIFELITGSDR